MVVFRSLLVPLKAVIMNLLSVGAAYGVLVAVFQWGWGKDLFRIGKDGPVEAWVPMMLFAVIFGLSMDYEVFLRSRIREDYDRTGDNATAVANGLAATARVITAAAAIMFCVFAGFVLGSERSLKMFGLGLATAVLLDATGGPARAGARDDGAARRPQLVAAPVAGSHPAGRPRRADRGGAGGRGARIGAAAGVSCPPQPSMWRRTAARTSAATASGGWSPFTVTSAPRRR